MGGFRTKAYGRRGSPNPPSQRQSPVRGTKALAASSSAPACLRPTTRSRSPPDTATACPKAPPEPATLPGAESSSPVTASTLQYGQPIFTTIVFFLSLIRLAAVPRGRWPTTPNRAGLRPNCAQQLDQLSIPWPNRSGRRSTGPAWRNLSCHEIDWGEPCDARTRPADARSAPAWPGRSGARAVVGTRSGTGGPMPGAGRGNRRGATTGCFCRSSVRPIRSAG